VFDPTLTSLPFIALSSSTNPIATSISDLVLLASPLPLAQHMGLGMGDPSRSDASVIKDDSLDQQKKLTLVEPFSKENPFE